MCWWITITLIFIRKLRKVSLNINSSISRSRSWPVRFLIRKKLFRKSHLKTTHFPGKIDSCRPQSNPLKKSSKWSPSKIRNFPFSLLHLRIKASNFKAKWNFSKIGIRHWPLPQIDLSSRKKTNWQIFRIKNKNFKGIIKPRILNWKGLNSCIKLKKRHGNKWLLNWEKMCKRKMTKTKNTGKLLNRLTKVWLR